MSDEGQGTGGAWERVHRLEGDIERLERRLSALTGVAGALSAGLVATLLIVIVSLWI